MHNQLQAARLTANRVVWGTNFEKRAQPEWYQNLDPQQRHAILGALIGGGGLGLTGLFGGGDDDEDEGVLKRVLTRALLGAGIGGAAGYGSKYLAPYLPSFGGKDETKPAEGASTPKPPPLLERPGPTAAAGAYDPDPDPALAGGTPPAVGGAPPPKAEAPAGVPAGQPVTLPPGLSMDGQDLGPEDPPPPPPTMDIPGQSPGAEGAEGPGGVTGVDPKAKGDKSPKDKGGEKKEDKGSGPGTAAAQLGGSAALMTGAQLGTKPLSKPGRQKLGLDPSKTKAKPGLAGVTYPRSPGPDGRPAYQRSTGKRVPGPRLPSQASGQGPGPWTGTPGVKTTTTIPTTLLGEGGTTTTTATPSLAARAGHGTKETLRQLLGRGREAFRVHDPIPSLSGNVVTGTQGRPAYQRSTGTMLKPVSKLNKTLRFAGRNAPRVAGWGGAGLGLAGLWNLLRGSESD